MMNMIDTIIINDSLYDDQHNGGLLKKRASLNKDYGKIDYADVDEYIPTTTSPVPPRSPKSGGTPQRPPSDDAHRGIGIALKG